MGLCVYVCLYNCVCESVCVGVHTYVQTKLIIEIGCDMTICIELSPGTCIMISIKKYIHNTARYLCIPGMSKTKQRLYIS